MTTTDRTARRIVAGTWGCALIVMAASAGNAVLTFGAIGGNRVTGLAVGLAVDIALCVSLIGDRWLHTHGLSSTWGRALRITAAAMSLVLNAGGAVHDGHHAVAALHAFLPVLLVVLCEYGQDFHQLTALRREQEHTGATRAASPVPAPPGAVGGATPKPTPPRHPRPATPGPQYPRPTQPLRAQPPRRPPPGAADILLDRARELRAHRENTPGRPTGRERAALRDQLGITDRAARNLVRRLNTEPHLTTVGDTP